VIVRRQDICAFTVLAQVKAQKLLFLADPQTHYGFEHEQNYSGAHGDEHDSGPDGNQLRDHESRISINQSIVASRVDRFRSENARQERTDDSADSMYADHIE